MKFQWLKDYQELEEHLIYLKWNLNKSKLELLRWIEGDLQGVKLEKNSRASSLEEKIQFLEKEIDQIVLEIDEAKDFISSFNGVDNQILKLKYIDNFTLEEISEQLGYSNSYIRKRHANIRKTLKFLDSYLEKRQERLNKTIEIEVYEDKLKE